MEHISKKEFIDTYFEGYKSEFVEKFSTMADNISYDELIDIIKGSFNEELDYWLDDDGKVDEDNFSFRDFINDVELSIEGKIMKISNKKLQE